MLSGRLKVRLLDAGMGVFMRIGIIEAGMAGLSCAQALRHQGHDVIAFDKGRGPGGRMSTRRIDTSLGEAAFDHGAQDLTARDPAFVAQVEHWAQDGHVARWSPDARMRGLGRRR